MNHLTLVCGTTLSLLLGLCELRCPSSVQCPTSSWKLHTRGFSTREFLSLNALVPVSPWNRSRKLSKPEVAKQAQHFAGATQSHINLRKRYQFLTSSKFFYKCYFFFFSGKGRRDWKTVEWAKVVPQITGTNGFEHQTNQALSPLHKMRSRHTDRAGAWCMVSALRPGLCFQQAHSLRSDTLHSLLGTAPCLEGGTSTNSLETIFLLETWKEICVLQPLLGNGTVVV